MNAKQSPAIDLPFEKALAELEDIVKKLESSSIPIADMISAYERGKALENHCNEILRSAQLRIEKITLTDGVPQVQKADTSE